jgi:hypothetical protein
MRSLSLIALWASALVLLTGTASGCRESTADEASDGETTDATSCDAACENVGEQCDYAPDEKVLCLVMCESMASYIQPACESTYSQYVGCLATSSELDCGEEAVQCPEAMQGYMTCVGGGSGGASCEDVCENFVSVCALGEAEVAPCVTACEADWSAVVEGCEFAWDDYLECVATSEALDCAEGAEHCPDEMLAYRDCATGGGSVSSCLAVADLDADCSGAGLPPHAYVCPDDVPAGCVPRGESGYEYCCG